MFSTTPIGGGAGVEEDSVVGAVLGHVHQDREATIGQRDLGDVAAFHGGRRPAATMEDGQRWPVSRSLIRHEGVGHIVHQRRHCHRVDRFEAEDHPGLEIVQHLRMGLVQMGGGLVVGAHADHSP